MNDRVDAAVIDAYREADFVLMQDTGRYIESLVKIKDKDSGAVIDFTMKPAQRIVHDACERMLAEVGYVRLLVLKYRQGGISTYVAARFYKGTSLGIGQKTYILTHEDKATQNLFGMAKRIHENIALDYRPTDTAKNANELHFGKIDSGYQVGTAKNVHGSGRSLTVHRFHGSEAAWWAQAEQHLSGVMQAVPDAPGTEIILETTANGPIGAFYEQWLLAEAGKSDFRAVFLPWMIEQNYRKPVRGDVEFSTEELEYQVQHSLDNEQLTWMHFKNIELGGEPGKICALFRQEYPATAQEAFQTSGEASFIPGRYILAARQNKLDTLDFIPVVLGVDVGLGRPDKTRILDRHGRVAGSHYDKELATDDTMVIADEVIKAIKETGARLTFIDVTGIGKGVYDRCCQLGYTERVVAVSFGASASDPQRYINKRAECWGRMAEWFKDPGGSQVPDNDTLHRHIAAPVWGPQKTRYDANRRLQIESKESIYDRLKFSPDGGDALSLTFAQEVIDMQEDTTPAWMKELQQKGGGGWMSR